MSFTHYEMQRNTSKSLIDFLVGFALLLLYIYLYLYVYEFGIFPRWGYFGFRLEGLHSISVAVSILYILVLYLVLPKSASWASDYILWLLFVLSFIPIQLTISISGTAQNGINLLQAALFISFLVAIYFSRFLSSIAWLGLVKSNSNLGGSDYVVRHSVNKSSVQKTILASSVFFSIILIVKFYPVMSFSGMDEVYQQRAAAADYGINVFFGYIILWSTYLIGPLMLLIGLVRKRSIFIFGSIVVFTIVYMVNASKIVFVIFSFYIAIYYFNRFGLKDKLYLLLLAPVFPLLASFVVDLSSPDGSIVSYIVDQLVVRGIAIQAMIFNLYVEFFSNNPNTYYSHVAIFSSVIEYPYDLPIGRVISLYQYGHPDANANSGIWAADGVAAAGEIGVIIVGLLLGLFLGFLNRLTKGGSHEILSLAMVPLAMLMVNASLFTTLASGGGLLLVFAVRALCLEFKKTSYNIDNDFLGEI